MSTFKKYLFWITIPVMFIISLIFAIIEEIGYCGSEALHHFEAWCFNYKDSGLIYRGDGIWSSPHKGEKRL